MTQKERQERSKREIFRAAMEEFGTMGYHAVTMESICTRHGISKGMMYHYYSNKDELFLLCVEDTLAQLRTYIEQHMQELEEENPLEAIRKFFMLRESCFQTRPEQKKIFEDAIFHPSKGLTEEISKLRAPLRQVNRQFLLKVMSRMDLRPELDIEKVSRYLEGLDLFMWPFIAQYQAENEEQNLHTMLTATEEMMDMVLFGIARRKE